MHALPSVVLFVGACNSVVEYTPDKRKVDRSIRFRLSFVVIYKIYMPQFDISSFFNQVFWLGLFFSVFYFMILGFLLPEIVSGVKARNKKEKAEFSLVFNELLMFNKTKLLLVINQKLSRVKVNSKFSSAL